MAKRRRKYRGLGDIVALPFSNLVDDIQGSMKGTDVLVGALVGVAGIGAFNWLKAQTWAPAFLKTNTTVARFTPALVGVAAAAGAYFGDKKLLKMPSRAAGHAAGALGVGLALQAIQEATPSSRLSDIVDLRLNGLRSTTYRRRALNGMIIDDRSASPLRFTHAQTSSASPPRMALLRMTTWPISASADCRTCIDVDATDTGDHPGKQ
jgi:hypothetical protein